MESERFWILILALVTFLAGLAGGVLLGGDLLRSPHEPRAFEVYEEQLVATFELDPDQTGNLRWILNRYHRDLEQLKARNLEGLEDELIRIGENSSDLIVRYVLREDQRDKFQRMAEGDFAGLPRNTRPAPQSL
jgi:hypothetical protein